MKNKNYWATYFNVDPNLPDKEFYKKIGDINRLIKEKNKQYTKRNLHQMTVKLNPITVKESKHV